jgi:hypothetical protein
MDHRMTLAHRSQRRWLVMLSWLDDNVGMRGHDWEILEIFTMEIADDGEEHVYEILFLHEEDLVRFKLTWL